MDLFSLCQNENSLNKKDQRKSANPQSPDSEEAQSDKKELAMINSKSLWDKLRRIFSAKIKPLISIKLE